VPKNHNILFSPYCKGFHYTQEKQEIVNLQSNKKKR